MTTGSFSAPPTIVRVSEPRTFRQHRFQTPPSATELILVRHGESQPAVDGQKFPLVDGHGDPPLSPEGEAQAQRVCARLAREHIDAVYVTNLQRTHQTAAGLVAALGIEPVVEPDLREVHLGEWEGGEFRRRVADLDPIAVRMFTEERWDVIPGAEPADVFAGRVTASIDRIWSNHPDQRVAVFAHGGVIGQILAHATRSRPFAFSGADNASISHLVVGPTGWVLRRFNDTTHLDDQLTTDAAPLT